MSPIPPGPRRVRRLFIVAPLLALVAAALPTPAMALGDYVGFEPAPWAQSLEATATIDSGGTPGTSFDFNDTLGVDENDTAKMGRLWFRLKKNRLSIDFADIANSGSSTLTQNVTFNGNTYTASETVATDFGVQLLQARYRYSFVDLKVVEIGAGVGLTLAQIDMRLDGSTTGITTLNEDVPIPTLHAAVTFKPLPGFHIRAEADALGVAVSGNDVNIRDARLQLEYYFAHFFGLYAGYRSFRFDVKSDDFGTVDATFKGPYFGLGVKF